jgi:two-component system chemotaxis response regulator CheY
MPRSSTTPSMRSGLELLRNIFEVAQSHLHHGQSDDALVALLVRYTQASLVELGHGASTQVGRMLSGLCAVLNQVNHKQRSLNPQVIELAIRGLKLLDQEGAASLKALEGVCLEIEKRLTPVTDGQADACHAANTEDTSQFIKPSAQTRILIVEDDLVSRRTLSHFMGKIGQCDVATTGAEGIVSFLLALEEGAPYSLLLLDIMIPGVNGHQLLQQVRRLEAVIPRMKTEPCKIIMVSGLEDKNSVLSAFREGCEGYLVKPIDFSKMDEMLAKLGLGKRRDSHAH